MTLTDSNTNVHLKNTISVIKGANDKLSIFAGCLSSPLSNDNSYIYELSNFIEKPNSFLEILLSNYNENSAKNFSNLLKRLAYYISSGHKDRIIIKYTSRNINFAEDEKKEPVYFLLNENGGYCISSNYLSEALKFSITGGILSKTLSETFNNLSNEANILDVLTLFKASTDDTDK